LSMGASLMGGMQAEKRPPGKQKKTPGAR
jgi:hypothetical protein